MQGKQSYGIGGNINPKYIQNSSYLSNVQNLNRTMLKNKDDAQVNNQLVMNGNGGVDLSALNYKGGNGQNSVNTNFVPKSNSKGTSNQNVKKKEPVNVLSPKTKKELLNLNLLKHSNTHHTNNNMSNTSNLILSRANQNFHNHSNQTDYPGSTKGSASNSVLNSASKRMSTPGSKGSGASNGIKVNYKVTSHQEIHNPTNNHANDKAYNNYSSHKKAASLLDNSKILNLSEVEESYLDQSQLKEQNLFQHLLQNKNSGGVKENFNNNSLNKHTSSTCNQPNNFKSKKVPLISQYKNNTKSLILTDDIHVNRSVSSYTSPKYSNLIENLKSQFNQIIEGGKTNAKSKNRFHKENSYSNTEKYDHGGSYITNHGNLETENYFQQNLNSTMNYTAYLQTSPSKFHSNMHAHVDLDILSNVEVNIPLTENSFIPNERLKKAVSVVNPNSSHTSSKNISKVTNSSKPAEVKLISNNFEIISSSHSTENIPDKLFFNDKRYINLLEKINLLERDKEKSKEEEINLKLTIEIMKKYIHLQQETFFNKNKEITEKKVKRDVEFYKNKIESEREALIRQNNQFKLLILKIIYQVQLFENEEEERNASQHVSKKFFSQLLKENEFLRSISENIIAGRLLKEEATNSCNFNNFNTPQIINNYPSYNPVQIHSYFKKNYHRRQETKMNMNTSQIMNSTLKPSTMLNEQDLFKQTLGDFNKTIKRDTNNLSNSTSCNNSLNSSIITNTNVHSSTLEGIPSISKSTKTKFPAKNNLCYIRGKKPNY